MLELTIPRTDLWDERNQRFIPVKEQKLRSFHFQNGKVDGAKSSYLKSRRPLKKPLIIYAV